MNNGFGLPSNLRPSGNFNKIEHQSWGFSEPNLPAPPPQFNITGQGINNKHGAGGAGAVSMSKHTSTYDTTASIGGQYSHSHHTHHGSGGVTGASFGIRKHL